MRTLYPEHMSHHLLGSICWISTDQQGTYYSTFRGIHCLLISFPADVGVCLYRQGWSSPAKLQKTKGCFVVLCCVSESIGQFQVTFVLQCLLFQKQLKLLERVLKLQDLRHFPPAQTTCAHMEFIWLGASVWRWHNHMDFAAISRGDRHVAGSWMRLLISCWSGKCSVPVLLIFPSTSTWLSWMFYYQVLAKKKK